MLGNATFPSGLIIALLLVFGFVSCTDKEEINDWEEPDSHESIASDSVSNLSIASQLAAKKVGLASTIGWFLLMLL
jgi:hypothetical protein